MIPKIKTDYEKVLDHCIDLYYERKPDLMKRYGERGRQKCREDNVHHIKHLETALNLKNEKVFTDYALWLNGILKSYGMDENDLIENFSVLGESIEKFGNPEEAAYFNQYLTAASKKLSE